MKKGNMKHAIRKKCNMGRVQHEEGATLEDCNTEKVQHEKVQHEKSIHWK